MRSKIATSVVFASTAFTMFNGVALHSAGAKPVSSSKKPPAGKSAGPNSAAQKAAQNSQAQKSQTAAIQNSAALTYENLRVALTPVAIHTANDVLAHTDELAGRAVEMQGVVCGIMSNTEGAKAAKPSAPDDATPAMASSETAAKTGKICLLQLPDAIVPLNVPDTVETGALRANATLRVIALVNDGPASGTLTILALTDTPASPSSAQPSITSSDTTSFGTPHAVIVPQGAPSVQGRTVTVTQRPLAGSGATYMQRPTPGGDNLVLRGNGIGSGDDIVVVPPMTETTLPEPDKSAVQADSQRNAPIRPLAREPWDVDAIDSQVPSYKALVLRHNPRLRDDQANEIAEALLRHGYAQNIDPRFLAAVVCVESGFNPYAVSHSGAMGLGQLMPFNLRGLGIQNAWDCSENIRGCAMMLRRLLDQFAGRPDSTLLAVAAYNAGANAVVRAGYRVPGGSQVQGYVWKIYNRYKAYAPDMFQ